ncbi:MAG: murein L,D-transpeptidase [Bacteroidia bacterium]
MRINHKYFLQFFTLVLLTLSGCTGGNNKENDQPIKDTIITSFDVKSNFILDSLFFDSLASALPDLTTYTEQARRFYSNRDWSYAWFKEDGLREHAGFLFHFLQSARLEGIQDSLSILPILSERLSIYSVKDSLMQPDRTLEAMLTISFFWYTDKSWTGLPEEKSKAMSWFLPRMHIDKEEWLDSALVHSPDGSLLSKAVFRQYYWLRKYLVQYDSLSKAETWSPVVYPERVLRIGDTDSTLLAIGKSLFLHGDLDSMTSSIEFDSTLFVGAIRFQKRHGLTPDGVLGKKFYEALNVSVADRIEQILINMERSRWMPSDYPQRYLIVNIPDFNLYAYDNGIQIWNMNVVVGKEIHETVSFSGEMRNVVFNPYWVVPPGILYDEIIPGIIKKPNYLSSHNMELVNASGKVISSTTVDWKKYTKSEFPYTIRQKPGTSNSLGKVKFLFPNSHNIYLHDSPARSLYKEENRAFSHGCVRLSDPEKLANYVLEHEGWTPERVKKALLPGKESWVKLENKLPVYIVYFTAWVENDGQLHFRKDVYHRDEKLKNELIPPAAVDSASFSIQ